jgi:hypothetical protein
MIPNKKDSYYNKKLDVSKIELLLSSMKLTFHKVVELVKSLKNHNLDWRDELLLTSIYYDVQVIKDVIDYESKRSIDRKLIDKLNALRILIDELEAELKAERKEPLKPLRHEDIFEEKAENHTHHKHTAEHHTDNHTHEEHIEVPVPPAPQHQEKKEETPKENNDNSTEIQSRLHAHIEILPPELPRDNADERKKNDEFL